ncbi:LytTR family DNA-binding domain-containing protein [uncultured Hyphomonas sp.]|uniref:LytR/AlgR family response regulator transcription factor n=1 Tax=uncultured Hyphomonas sp. TaxID=225298 RepID=UPI002AAAB8D2|nr:LytTR family DNA-binding domain-containing protein [uncultured Hyphomonas sp.]
METRTQHPEIRADRRADRRTWLFFAIFMLASFFEKSLSDHDDLLRTGAAHPNLPWLSEATSHLVILAMVPFITFMLSRFPFSADRWRQNLAIHAAATVAFSAVHVCLMVTFRKLLTPLVFGFQYDFGLLDPSLWLYEYRKDVLSYALIAAIFWTNRLVEQRDMEAEAAKTDAKDRHRLTLKSGGRTFFVNADDVIWARAASNYVEVGTPAKTHLARMTLTELERLLEEAGGHHARVHRSHIVHLDHVIAIMPTGEGDAMIELDTGETVPGSRRYRERYAQTA